MSNQNDLMNKRDGLSVTTNTEPTLTTGDWQMAKWLLAQAKDRIRHDKASDGCHITFFDGNFVGVSRELKHRILRHRFLMLRHCSMRLSPNGYFTSDIFKIATELPYSTLVATVAKMVAVCRISGSLKL